MYFEWTLDELSKSCLETLWIESTVEVSPVNAGALRLGRPNGPSGVWASE